MSTGISFLDGIVNGVNNAYNSVSSFINNATNYSNNVYQQNTQLMSNWINSVNTTANSVYNSFSQPYVQQPPPIYTQPITYQNNYPYQYPSVISPYTVATPQYNQSPYFTAQQMQQLGNALNFTVQQLQSSFPSLFGSYTQPFTTTVNNLYNGFVDYTNQQITGVKNALTSLGQNVYASTSNILAQLGIQTNGWGNLLDATVRTVMQNLGYSASNQIAAVSNMLAQGQTQQANAIYATQMQLNNFIQKIDYAFADTKQILDSLSKATDTYTTEQPKDLIILAIDSAATELIKVLKETIEYGQKNPNSFFAQLSTRIGDISYVIDNLKQGKYKSSDELFNALFGNDTSSGLARALIILASVVPTLISAVNLAGTPALESFQYLVNADNPVKKLGIGEYLNAYFKSIITYPELSANVKKLGIGPDELKLLILQAQDEPQMQFMIGARRRGVIGDEEWKTWLDEQRFTDSGKKIFNYMLDEIPSPQDLTRIADKRVWSLQTQPKYGQFSEVPKEYYDYMKMWGYDRKFIDWLWAAHWELPSPNQVFEMVHRGLVNKEDLDTYLGLTDWLPYFRDKLFEITYNVFTRVDVRRLYKEGILNDAELHQQHLKMGYTEQDAQKLDAYVKQTNLPEDETEYNKLEKRVIAAVEKGYSTGRIDRNEATSMLTYLGVSPQLANQELNILDFETSINNVEPTQKSLQQGAISVIRAAYKKGNISRQDALNYLLASGYGTQEADQELYFLDLENTIRLKSMAQDTAQKLFAAFEISDVDFHNRLNALGFSAREVELSYQEALLMRDNRTKKLTYAQLQKLFKSEVITVDEYADQLKGLGYTDQSVYWIISQELTPDIGAQ